jgi:hypothetical protein
MRLYFSFNFNTLISIRLLHVCQFKQGTDSTDQRVEIIKRN